MILLIDNYDSFVYTLADYASRLGHDCRVMRNDALSVENVQDLNPAAIILSPGPCAPAQAGICVELIRAVGPYIPILGVCLGHQAIGEAYGGQTIRAAAPMHGKASQITHDGGGLFLGLPNPLQVGRYHSLITSEPTGALSVTARSDTGEIMALAHDTYPVYGVQFHPESILTPQGLILMDNFFTIAQSWVEKSERRA
jgi:anthranilate synthase component 2/para-aminobenzoate synthetase component 2